MLHMIEHVFIEQSLVAAFAVVGAVMWLSLAISRRFTAGRVHGSAIAIVAGLVLAYAGGLMNGGQKGLADVPVFAGIGNGFRRPDGHSERGGWRAGCHGSEACPVRGAHGNIPHRDWLSGRALDLLSRDARFDGVSLGTHSWQRFIGRRRGAGVALRSDTKCSDR